MSPEDVTLFQQAIQIANSGQNNPYQKESVRWWLDLVLGLFFCFFSVVYLL